MSSSSQFLTKGVLTQSLGGKKQCAKRKYSTPKKQRADKTPELMNFMVNNSVPSVIVKPIVSNSITTSIPSVNSKEIFVLMLGTKNELSFIQPIIIKTEDIDYTQKEFYKCRIAGVVYVARIISTSKSLNRLEETVPTLVDKIAIGWRAKIIKSDHLIVSCTKLIKFQNVQLPDLRVGFLKEILSTMDTSMLNSQLKVTNDSSVSIMDNSTTSMEEEEGDNLLDKLEDASSGNDELSISPITTPVSVRKNSYILEDEDDEDADLKKECFDLSSGSDDDKDSQQILSKKRRKRIHTDVKLLTKLREDKRKKLDDANFQIVSLTSNLNEMIPALPIDNVLTPSIKNLYKFCDALNAKLNNFSSDKINQENTIPLARAINVSKVKGKDQMDFNGLILPLSAYAWACQAEEPRLVVSRLMRGCIPDSMKTDCTVNEKADESNFLFRLGDEKLSNFERLANGQEQMESLIEHAHHIKRCTSMSLSSYRECKIQIDKALYDFARTKQKKNTQEKNQDISEQQSTSQEEVNYLINVFAN